MQGGRQGLVMAQCECLAADLVLAECSLLFRKVSLFWHWQRPSNIT